MIWKWIIIPSAYFHHQLFKFILFRVEFEPFEDDEELVAIWAFPLWSVIGLFCYYVIGEWFQRCGYDEYNWKQILFWPYYIFVQIKKERDRRRSPILRVRSTNTEAPVDWSGRTTYIGVISDSNGHLCSPVHPASAQTRNGWSHWTTASYGLRYERVARQQAMAAQQALFAHSNFNQHLQYLAAEQQAMIQQIAANQQVLGAPRILVPRGTDIQRLYSTSTLILDNIQAAAHRAWNTPVILGDEHGVLFGPTKRTVEIEGKKHEYYPEDIEKNFNS